ncbi:hypothetical protein ACFQZ4_45025 [Catellatospora coxensis]
MTTSVDKYGTVRNPDDGKYLKDLAITDYPNRVRELMAERGMKLPKAYQAH